MAGAGTSTASDSRTAPPVAPAGVVGAAPGSQLVRFAIPLALVLTLFAWTIPGIPSADTWWHLRSGEYIVEMHSIPRVDPFSYTVAGRPWIAQEWLAEVLTYLVFRMGAMGALLLFFGALSTLAFVLVYLRTPGAPLGARVGALGLAVWTAAPTFSTRPQAFSLMLASVVLYLVGRFRDEGRASLLVPLLPIAALWVNLHGAYILEPALVVIAMAGAVFDSLLGRQTWQAGWRELRSLMATVLGCLALVPLNPNGFAMYRYPLDTLHLQVLQANIMEWRSPDFHLSIFLPFVILLFGGVASFALSKERPLPSEVLLFCGFAYAALRAMRNVSLFALVAAPLLAKYLPLPALRWGEERPWNPRRVLALVALGVAVPLSALSVRTDLSLQKGLEWLRFPQDAVTYLEQNHLPGPILNSYDNGGYLLWRLYPKYRVYIDGRTDLYGEEFLENFLGLYRGQIDPRPELDRRGIQTVIIEPGAILSKEMDQLPGWKRVFGDDRAVVYTRAFAPYPQ